MPSQAKGLRQANISVRQANISASVKDIGVLSDAQKKFSIIPPQVILIFLLK